MDNQQGPTEIAQATLLNVMGQSRREGRMDIRICMAESLRFSPETITTLLISYTPQTK